LRIAVKADRRAESFFSLCPLLLARREAENPATSIFANGTAVVVVCVTGEASRILVPFASSETIPVASRYGAIFAITVSEGFVTIAVQVVC
jgi:hypothetical protein